MPQPKKAPFRSRPISAKTVVDVLAGSVLNENPDPRDSHSTVEIASRKTPLKSSASLVTFSGFPVAFHREVNEAMTLSEGPPASAFATW